MRSGASEDHPAAKDREAAEAQQAAHAHQEVFAEIDCLECANCCKSLPALVTEEDVQRISAHLDMNPGMFKATYLVFDEDDDMVTHPTPCPFLELDNRCRIYTVRPESCRQYPHTDGEEFVRRKHLHAKNAEYCPAVQPILNRLAAWRQEDGA